ncbi:UNVERIFIED_CONTAM: drug/metabolite transporter (DMT)-like permease [Brevibacillus sp. OAP136]
MGKFSAKTAIAIASLVLIWGVSWSIYKVALHYTPPILFAGMRSLFGGLLLALFLLPRRKQIHWRENWYRYTISALYSFTVSRPLA